MAREANNTNMPTVSEALIREVIAPMLNMKNSVVVSASTQLDPSDSFAKFFTDEYKKSNPMDHLMHTHDDHINPGSDASGDHHEMLRETFAPQPIIERERMGAICPKEMPVIRDEEVEALRNRPMECLEELVPEQTTVWTYVDPSGGSVAGTSNKLAICSLIRNGKQKVIVGLHAGQTETAPDGLDQIAHYFGAIAKDAKLSACRHILFVANHVASALTVDSVYRRGCTLLPKMEMVNWFKDLPGVKKTFKNTHSAVMSLLVDLTEDNIAFYHDLCSVSPESKIDALRDFFSQLGHLHVVVRSDGRQAFSAEYAGEGEEALVAMYMTSYFSYHVMQMRESGDNADKGDKGNRVPL
jgi:hypothetical protein